jgi:hypothetical protein
MVGAQSSTLGKEVFMRVTITVGEYNARRYSRPWIARVKEWPVGAYPELVFGGHLGVNEAEIEAAPGDIVKYGQKDHRGHNGFNEFGVVTATGGVLRLTPGQARKAWEELKAKRDVN